MGRSRGAWVWGWGAEPRRGAGCCHELLSSVVDWLGLMTTFGGTGAAYCWAAWMIGTGLVLPGSMTELSRRSWRSMCLLQANSQYWIASRSFYCCCLANLQKEVSSHKDLVAPEWPCVNAFSKAVAANDGYGPVAVVNLCRLVWRKNSSGRC